MKIEVLISKYKFLSEIYNIASKAYIGQFKPHKLLMLLVVFDLYDIYPDFKNQIKFNPELHELYSRHYDKYKQGNDLNRPWMPFFHLKTSYFWNHYVFEDSKNDYLAYKSSDGPTKLSRLIQYSFLVDDVHLMLLESTHRDYYRSIISEILIENRTKIYAN